MQCSENCWNWKIRKKTITLMIDIFLFWWNLKSSTCSVAWRVAWSFAQWCGAKSSIGPAILLFQFFIRRSIANAWFWGGCQIHWNLWSHCNFICEIKWILKTSFPYRSKQVHASFENKRNRLELEEIQQFITCFCSVVDFCWFFCGFFRRFLTKSCLITENKWSRWFRCFLFWCK